MPSFSKSRSVYKKIRGKKLYNNYTRIRFNDGTSNMPSGSVVKMGIRRPYPMSITRKPMPFPSRFYCKNPYSSSVTLNSVAAVFGAVQEYRLNSVYDPDLTGVGGQPMGRDTLATIYNRYKVYAVTVKCRFIDPATNAVCCAIRFKNPSTTVSLAGQTISYAREMPNTYLMYSNNTGNQVRTFRRTIPIWKILGVTKQQFSGDVGLFDALVGNNPDSTYGQAKLEVAAADATGATTGAVVACETEIIYHTMWHQRETLPQS